MKQTYDLTQGKVTPLILRFYIPMFFTNLLQQLYSIADTIIVGKGLGDNALAAVGNMSSLTFLIIGFSLGMANGFTVLTAQSYGAGDYARMRKTIASSIQLAAGIGAILTVLSVFYLRDVLVAMQTSELILADSLCYGYIIFGGLAANIAYNLCACILRALGDSRTPFFAIITSTIVNVVFNCVFIFGLHMGVEGAAIATIFSQLMSAGICLLKLRKIDIIRLSAEDFRFDGSMMLALLKNGIPMACMNSITAIGCMVVQYFVNGMGVAYTSAYSACSRYINLFMQPACTAGFTMSSFTSQNYGAGKFSRIREGLHVCLTIALISYVLLGAVMVFFPRQLASLMLTGEESISLTMQYLSICGITLCGVDFLFVFRSGVQGMGKPFIPMCSGIIEMVMRIAVIVLMVPEVGFRATAYAETVAWFGALALNFIAFQYLLSRRLRMEKRSAPVVHGVLQTAE
ncbi:MAG: MATE family efflux transporter [Ruminococcus sp.]|nr:MATE family efflux transporter [Ruminococcus sp.]